MANYKPTASYKLIYVYKINDDKHKDILKIGKAELASSKSESELLPNCDELNFAAKNRINQQTKTALIDYELLHTELALRHIKLNDGSDRQEDFIDIDIHNLLKKSGFNAVKFEDSGKDSEWFYVDLNTIKRAIHSYKNGFNVIENKNRNYFEEKSVHPKIVLRKEQEENIVKTMNIFKTTNKMLWDCKMRYGKTVTAYELIKRMNLKKVIVVTHRPAVEDGWDTDHKLIFEGTNHTFIDKSNEKIDDFSIEIDSKNDKLLSDYEEQNIPFTYFASIQDLRGSKRVGGKYNKNNKVFDMEWDLLIIDEAHEGTQTDLGEAVIKSLVHQNTKILSLTGTAYGIIKDYGDNVFTWTYVDEQKAKREWQELHSNEKNPYEDLPNMNILTFDLTNAIENSYRYVTAESAFNFREFFRVWTGDIKNDYIPVPENKKIGDFVHEDAIWSFLNLITNETNESNYPFSKEEYRQMFKHTFWIVPGVKEAKALSELLRIHPVFNNYRVVNVAGDGDEEERYEDALKKVKKAIKENDKTITISCGRLTTGITIREWTAIMMLSGSHSTSVNGYMQAIFRVQSPGMIEGKRKEECYVFDFAPDRALKVISEVYRLSSKNRTIKDEDHRVALGEFLNFCPVIAVEGTEMREYDVPSMMRQIKRISVDSAINSGFDDNTIYLTDAGLYKDDIDEDLLKKLANVIEPKRKGNKNKSVIIAKNGLTEEQYRKIERAKKKEHIELTPEERYLLEKEKEARKQQQKLFDLLRAISIRLPLLFYGAEEDITEIIKLKDFVEIVDDESWKEFLPTNLTKELFLAITKYYDEDVLVGAGLRIRKLAKAADDYPPNIRATKIFEILSKFKNPDKETVLTPWNVVNMHLGETIGGYNFFDENGEELEEPRLINIKGITEKILLNNKAKVLEINSKSGLYPLYIAYSFYNNRINGDEKNKPLDELQKIWEDVLNNNVYALCKTKMARSITVRTLSGYTKRNVNAIYLTKLVDKRMRDLERLTKKITNPNTWGKEGYRMKFDAVVGNPPYQGINHQQIYPDFYLISRKLGQYVSLIFPVGWQQPKNANNLSKLNNQEIKTDKQIMYIDNKQNVFPGISGAEWVNVLLWKKDYDNNLNGKQLIYTNGTNPKEVQLIWDKNDIEKPDEIIKLVKCVEKYIDAESLEKYTSSLKPYGLRTDYFDEPEKYGLPQADSIKKNDNDLSIYGLENRRQTIKYIPIDFPLPKQTDAINKYKVFIGKAWGNFSNGYLGGAYADIIIASPSEICTESFLESGIYNDFETAQKHAKYLMTKFARALLFAAKNSQDNSKEKWKFVPIEDFNEEWWNDSINHIDEKLFEKYKVPYEVREFVNNNIQERTIDNIINYNNLIDN